MEPLLRLKLKHVDLAAENVVQDAREVNTKFSKSFTTWFFPVGEDIHAIVAEWIAYLREQKLWGGDDPLFPATAVVNGVDLKFEAAGLSRRHWSNAGPMQAIFKGHSRWPGLRTSIPTRSAKHSLNSETRYAARLKS